MHPRPPRLAFLMLPLLLAACVTPAAPNPPGQLVGALGTAVAPGQVLAWNGTLVYHPQDEVSCGAELALPAGPAPFNPGNSKNCDDWPRMMSEMPVSS